MSYPGGKNGAGVYQAIINMMPPHRVYVEPFLGSGAVMRMKRPAALNFGFDLDPAAIEAFRLQASSPDSAVRYFSTTPPLPTMPAVAAYAPPRPAGVDVAGTASLDLAVGSALDFLRAYPFRGDEMVYADPPYLQIARRSSRPIYRHEFATAEQHVALLEVLMNLPCMVMLSGYRSDLYDRALARWRRAEFQTTNRAGKRTLECVWMNFAEPLELHDYRFLGRDFRERERIKRKRVRWQEKLRRMPALERHAILSAVAELREGPQRQN